MSRPRSLLVVALPLTCLLTACTVGTPDGAPTTPADATPTGATASSTPRQSPTASPSGTPSASTSPTPAPAPSGTTAPSTSSPAPSTRTTVGVTITYSGVDPSAAAAVVGGYADTIESDGTCELELRSGQRVATASAAATPDASSTACGELAVPLSDLAPGTWTALLTYRSTTSEGTSSPVEVVVP